MKEVTICKDILLLMPESRRPKSIKRLLLAFRTLTIVALAIALASAATLREKVVWKKRLSME